jgi:hypothetical protein
MMRKTIDRRLTLTLFFVAILVLGQFFITQRYRTAIIGCSLVDPDQKGERFSTLYGIPLTVVGTETKIDCSGNPTTQISDFSMTGLLVDILFVVVVGALPHLVFSLFDRFRHRNNE